MKTLDEVIKAYEICLNDNETSCHDCPYTEFNAEGKWACSLCGDCTEDALHYLKEYREKHDDILRMEEALGYCEIMDNPPLSWDELKQMEGKPVWVEYEKNGNHWLIITDIKSNGAVGRGVYGENAPLYKDRIGTDWQAYRKERQ